ncbi:MAG: hypothetical protein C4547_02835 [Phycisphaerales bacterium]|nr:MAG: hypothetical protein C4547_02835 [Phycisphaerales bacterium]
MAGKTPPDDGNKSSARHAASELDRAKAGKWFERANEFATQKRYDSAIEYYVNGLGFWPDAVDEGLRPLHVSGVLFKQTGGKKPGLRDSMKRSMTAKDPAEALQNALWLFGHDPDNAAYVEGLLKNANGMHCDDLVLWAVGVFRKLLDGDKKPNVKRYKLLKEVVEETADRASDRGEIAFAISVLEAGVEALSGLARRLPRDREVETTVRDLSTKLTIVRGRYQDAGSFRDSLQDEGAQFDLHDQDRIVQDEHRHDDLIAKAASEYEAAPDEPGTLKKYVDLLLRREREEEEVRAIGVLVEHYKRTEKYSTKQWADDVYMKQLRRAVRDAQKGGDDEAAAQARSKLLNFEIKVFKERHERYPTDLRVLFEYAKRLFSFRRYDDAIPLLQRARSDPKNRDQCALYLGRCFYKRQLYDQAVETLQQAVSEHEIADDAVGKDLLYWLGRAQEARKSWTDARKVYGRLLQMDYNFRDVRDRMERMPAG